MTSWIELDGAANARDVGGLPTTDGGRIAAGRLLRSDNLQDLTQHDVQILRERLGVTDVVDLRSDLERSIEGTPPLAEHDVQHHHLSVLPEDGTGDTAEQAVLPWSPRSQRPEPERSERDRDAGPYLGYLLDRPDAVAQALHVIATSEGAAIVHCAAGKDRTGTIVAMALSVAGVSDADIANEYALSAQRIEAIVERLGRRPAYAEAMEGVSIDQHRPRAETMTQLLEQIRERWGDSAGWLREQGWSQDQISRLRDRLRA